MRRWTRCGLMFITFLSASRYPVFKCSYGDAMFPLNAKYSIIPWVPLCVRERKWYDEADRIALASVSMFFRKLKWLGKKNSVCVCLSVGALCQRPRCQCCHHHPLGEWDTVRPFFLLGVSEALRGKTLTACFVLASGVLASLCDCSHRRRERQATEMSGMEYYPFILWVASNERLIFFFFPSEAATSQSASVKSCTVQVEGWLCLVYWSFESSGSKIIILFVCFFLKRWAK